MGAGKEEGFSGTSIKDTWTKPRGVGSRVGGGDGWSEGEWWGGNGENYTSTTIKKVKKRKKFVKRKPYFRSEFCKQDLFDSDTILVSHRSPFWGEKSRFSGC